VSRQRRWADL